MTAIILALAKLGDYIQATPLFRGLSQRYANLIFIGSQKSALEAAELSGLFSETLLIDPSDQKALENFKAPKAKAIYNLSLAPAALRVLAKIQDKQSQLTIFGPQLENGLTRLPPTQALALAIMSQNRRWAPFNLVDIWRRLEPGYLAPNELYWPTAASKDQEKPRDSRLKVGLALGAGNARRRWPRECFQDLARKLSESLKAQIILLGAPAEKALGKALVKALSQSLSLGEDLIDLVGQTNLRELTQITRGLDLLIASDTGLTHLAAALGTKVLGLYFGPALAQETGPYAGENLVAQTLAPCGPCPESRPCPERVCLELPETSLVLKAARNVLGHKDPEPEPISPAKGGLGVVKIDEFGFKLEFEPQKTQPDLLIAQVIREAARASLDPNYQPRIQALNLEDLKLEPDFWLTLASRIFEAPNPALSPKNFLGALESFGLLSGQRTLRAQA
ncbi:MAG: glycosyltransferase family 9 protein [Deltaproteobacteria bacterium]|jgi:ADP-heptose:LPS heptosyltransferase|nr:glycosyltransferase family 9 protein [Deltaproteobacteria bacterium]